MITTEQAVARQAEHECLLSEAVALLRIIALAEDPAVSVEVREKAVQIINKAKGR